MSNLFQRLANQARGKGAPSVRAAARVRAEPVGVTARGERDAAPSLELEQVATVPGELRGSTPDLESAGNPVAPAGMLIAGLAATAAAQAPLHDRQPTRFRDPVSATLTVDIPSYASPQPEPRLPLPLLASQGAHTTLAAPRVKLGASTAQEVEPTEVHVHIGRIEITAEKMAPPRSKPAATRQPLALGDYLAKRQRGSR